MTNENAEPICKSCGKQWIKHLGAQGLCVENLKLTAALKQALEALDITTTVERWDEYVGESDKVQAAIAVAKNVLEKGSV